MDASGVGSQQLLSAQPRSRSFSSSRASSLLDLFGRRPRIFSKKCSPSETVAAPTAGGQKQLLRQPSPTVPLQIVVSELCVDRMGAEFEVKWTAFDSSWPESVDVQKQLESPHQQRHAPRPRSQSSPEVVELAQAAQGGLARPDPTLEAFLSSSFGSRRRDALCLELDRHLYDSTLSRFCEHAAIVDAMKQCF